MVVGTSGRRGHYTDSGLGQASARKMPAHLFFFRNRL